MAIVNYTEFFREEKDIYVQNCAPAQVSVTFDLGGGRVESVLFPNIKDPLNLTQLVPFQAIKGSIDFRKMLNRKPLTLRVLTGDEYLAHYTKLAKNQGISVDDAIERADARRKSIQNHEPLKDAPKPMKVTDTHEDDSGDGLDAETDVISPKVLHLCLQVHPSVPDQQKISAQTMLGELDALGDLTPADWMYIQTNGYYKSVKNLAKKNLSNLQVDEDVPVTTTKPKAKKVVKKATSTVVEE